MSNDTQPLVEPAPDAFPLHYRSPYIPGRIVDCQAFMLTSADYGYWPIEVRQWLDGFGWTEVDDIRFEREILPDGYAIDARTGGKWARWKHGPHVTVTARRGSEWKQQRFKIEGATWYPAKEPWETT